MKLEGELVEKVFGHLSSIVDAKESIDNLISIRALDNDIYSEKGLPFIVKKTGYGIRALYTSSNGEKYKIIVRKVEIRRIKG